MTMLWCAKTVRVSAKIWCAMNDARVIKQDAAVRGDDADKRRVRNENEAHAINATRKTFDASDMMSSEQSKRKKRWCDAQKRCAKRGDEWWGKRWRCTRRWWQNAAWQNDMKTRKRVKTIADDAKTRALWTTIMRDVEWYFWSYVIWCAKRETCERRKRCSRHDENQILCKTMNYDMTQTQTILFYVHYYYLRRWW